MLIRCIFRKGRIFNDRFNTDSSNPLHLCQFSLKLISVISDDTSVRASGGRPPTKVPYSQWNLPYFSPDVGKRERNVTLLLNRESLWAAFSRQCNNIRNRFPVLAVVFSAPELCKHWFIEFLRSVYCEGFNEVSQGRRARRLGLRRRRISFLIRRRWKWR